MTARERRPGRALGHTSRRGSRPPEERRGDGARRPASGPRRRRTPPAIWFAVALLAVGVAALALWLSRRGGPARPAPSVASNQALAETLEVAMRKHDWDSALRYLNDLDRSSPGNSVILRRLAGVMHNRATASAVRFGRPHPRLRTSADRIASEIRVFALMDSAAKLATRREEWALAQQWHGQMLEQWGLALDALEIYQEILDAEPSFQPTAGRAAWVRLMIEDPTRVPAQAAAAPAALSR